MTKAPVLVTALWASLLLFSLVACNTAPVKEVDQKQTVAGETKEEMVMRRNKEFWDARIAGDIKKAYEYLSSGSKTVLSLEGFAMKSVVAFRGFKEEKVECEEEICHVYGILTYDHSKMKGVSTPSKDNWVMENGVAWYVFPQ